MSPSNSEPVLASRSSSTAARFRIRHVGRSDQDAIMNEINDYLAPYSPQIRAVCDQVRAQIKEAVPGVQEKLVRGWQLIGYRTPPSSGSRYFCFIAPYGDRVRLGFEWGVLLADELRVLEDSGTQVRSLYFNDSVELRPDLVARYVKEAAQVAALSKQQKANRALQLEALNERAREDFGS